MIVEEPDAARLGDVDCDVVGNDHTRILVYELRPEDGAPLPWVQAHLGGLHAGLRTAGAILLRGLPAQADLFHGLVTAVGGEPLDYTDRSTPRTEISRGVYTSTDYPADQPIPMHNENSYADVWPTTLFFRCQTAPATGGATPIADSRNVLSLIPRSVRDRFAAGVLYTRTYRDGLGLGWREAFQTEDRTAVEAYCESHGQQYEWDGDILRTRRLRPSVQHDPETGVEVWFNQANLFHVSSLDEEVREALSSLYDEADLPRNAYLGDGTAIDPDDIAAITAAYDEASVAVPWREGDVLVVANQLAAHGRQPFTGERRILVAMS